MALPDYFKWGQGTPIVWGEAGASGVTNTLSLDALANGSGRMGAAVDLGPLWDQNFLAILWAETGTAPTAGNLVELYLAWSHDNTNWPGKVTGLDAAYPATVAANKLQLGLPAVTLKATNDATTVLKQNPVKIRPKARYVAPVVINMLGLALRDEATATDNGSRAILVPLLSSIED